MEDVREKFTVKVTGRGLEIIVSEDETGEKSLGFTASEALMLLDILRNEESELRRMAREQSPMPINIKFGM